jgi:hypothetical protein
VVGATLTGNMILNMFNPHLLTLFSVVFGNIDRWLIERSFRNDPSKAAVSYLGQDDLNAKYRGVDMELASRYAVLLNIIFMTMFYGMAFPIFYVFSSIALLVMFSTEKYAFLRHYQIPPAFDDQLQQHFIEILPFAVFLHAIMSFLFFSSETMASYNTTDFIYAKYTESNASSNYIFTMNTTSTSISISSIVEGNIFNIFSNIHSRLHKINCIPAFLVCLGFVLYYVLCHLIRCLPHGFCKKLSSEFDESTLTQYANFKDYWLAKRDVDEQGVATDMVTYHLQHRAELVHAYLRTKSGKQLVAYPEMFPDPYSDSNLPPVHRTNADNYDLNGIVSRVQSNGKNFNAMDADRLLEQKQQDINDARSQEEKV